MEEREKNQAIHSITFPAEPLTLEVITSLYPQLYTEKRLTEWQGLFYEQALVIRTEQGSATSVLTLRDAMPEQREYAMENTLLLEEWDNIEIHRYGNIAIIKADYSLTADVEIRKGVDVLTLVNEPEGWRIVNLVYEQTHRIQR